MRSFKPSPERSLPGLAPTTDLFTTCVRLAGGEPPPDREIDGVDLAPLLFEAGPSLRHSCFDCRAERLYAARGSRFKAHFGTQPACTGERPTRHDPPVLYDPGLDPSEQRNVADERGDVLTRSAGLVAADRATVTPVKLPLEERTETQ